MAKRAHIQVEFSEDSAQPLYGQLYDVISHKILQGAIKEGEKLPSIRGFADELKVSHATVERAYSQLALEGYVRNVPRSGYVVCGLDLGFLSEAEEGAELDLSQALETIQQDEFEQECLLGKKAHYDMAFTRLASRSFPRKIWARLFTRVLTEVPEESLTGYRLRTEPSLLQGQIAEYVQSARGVRCAPEQVVFQAGSEAALSAVMQLFNEQGLVIAHEEPGFEVMTAVAQRFRASMVPLPVEADSSAIIARLDKEKPKLIFATPSHQFPTGLTMDLEHRIALLQWAAENDAYIIEDDSCNEYRYATRAIPSLQSLDANGRVIYLCNFSKALSPGFRVAYLILPPHLLERWHRKFTFSWDSVPYLMQETLGLFMKEGHWATHLRKMVASNKRSHDALVTAFEREMGDKVTLGGKDSGMHLFVTVHNGMTQQELLDSALEQGVNVYGAKRYYWSHTPAPENVVMVGFSSIAAKDIAPAVAALRRAWFPEM